MPKEITISDKKKNVFQKEVLESIQDQKVETKEPSLPKQPPEEDTKERKAKELSNEKEDLKKTIGKEEKVKKKRERKPLKKWIVILLITLGVLAVGGGLFAFYYFGIFTFVKDPSDVISFPTDYLTTQTEEDSLIWEIIDLLEPEEPRTEESPLNGLLFTVEEMTEMLARRPVAVMVNNHVAARPQSGLNSADLVYESLVESGITRYMAVFWSEAPDKVGSVRSARNYYLEWLSPLDAIYIHDGCASSSNTSADACTNLYTYGIKDIATYGAWRLDDGVRISPHNEYNSVTNAWEYAATLDWDEFPEVESWSFKSDAIPDERGESSVVEIAFHTRLTNGGDYDVRWTYDPDTNTYLRRVGEK